MIFIEQRHAEKVTGVTSLFIRSPYKDVYVDLFHKLGGCYFHKKAALWESPLFNLSAIVNFMSQYDEISFLPLTNFDDIPQPIELTEVKGLNSTLYQYQLEGVEFGLNHKNWLLLDSPGLGKTIQIIALAHELKNRYNIQHVLIICGVNNLKMNWMKEIQKHCNLSAKILGQTVTKKGTIRIGSVAERIADLKSSPEEFFWITNIETLRNDDFLKALCKADLDLIVCDEIHKCKSNTSQQGKNFLKLINQNPQCRKIGLTGTILVNNPLDCYVPLKWLGYENSTFGVFKSAYINFGGPFNNEVIGYKNINYLKDTLSSCSLRRTKDIVDLPPKSIINEYVEMFEDEFKLYTDIEAGIADNVDKVDIDMTSLLGMLTRLRQVIACPNVLTSDNIKSAKIERAVDLTNDIISNNDKVVIFCTFKATVDELTARLDNYHPIIITGDVDELTISEGIEKFQTDDVHKVCICTWQKAGTGISLHRARYAIFIDTPYTSAEFEQCCDRIHRIVSTDPVFIYNLIAKETVDERVAEIVTLKRAVSDYVVDDKIDEASYSLLKNYILELKS